MEFLIYIVNFLMNAIPLYFYRLEREMNEKYEESSEEGSDNDEEDDLVVNLDQTTTSKVEMIPEEERSTHFLAIRITDEGILQKVNELQEHIVNKEEVNTLAL